VTEPTRIQLSRAKGWRMPPNTVKVDRTTRWGNPFDLKQTSICFLAVTSAFPAPFVGLHQRPSAGRSVDLFTARVQAQLEADRDYLEPLRGKNLACWCKVGTPCHGDVLLQLANR
jgi:Domain of unknown function (DUF4326)